MAQECDTGLGICRKRWKSGHLSSMNHPPEAGNITIAYSLLWVLKKGFRSIQYFEEKAGATVIC